jgi:hypothetical protein
MKHVLSDCATVTLGVGRHWAGDYNDFLNVLRLLRASLVRELTEILNGLAILRLGQVIQYGADNHI